MNVEKIKRLIELLVEREIKRQIPTIRNQILSELKTTPQPKQKTSQQLFKNPLLNEMILSAKPMEPEEDFDWRSELGGLAAMTPPPKKVDLQMEATTPASKTLIDIMNRDYTQLVKKMDSLPKNSGAGFEDLSFLDNVK